MRLNFMPPVFFFRDMGRTDPVIYQLDTNRYKLTERPISVRFNQFRTRVISFSRAAYLTTDKRCYRLDF